MLAIEVTFLTGRYVATAYNDRGAAEWPPHPARLFSALVATHFSTAQPDDGERSALQWLETLGAPEIAASAASERDIATVFVPVDDTSVVADFDVEVERIEALEAELLAARATLEQANVAARKEAQRRVASLEKALGKAREALDNAIRRETAVPAKVAKSAALDALKVLPESRLRQARTFPSVTPADPRVSFIWPEAEPTSAQRARLEGLLAHVVRLGHSSSLVSARLLDAPPVPSHVPGDQGQRLRVVSTGQLEALERAFALHRETEPRVMPARFQYYEARRPPAGPEPESSCFSEEWIVLRRTGGATLPGQACVGVAKVLRRALMRFATEPIPELLSGHQADGSPSESDHLAIAPLPFVASAHATGQLLGLALLFPRSATVGDRRSIYLALDAWERTQRADDEEVPRVPLYLGQAGVWELMRMEGPVAQLNLRAETWCRAARSWVTASPVALDRNPGDLRERDAVRLARVLEESAETVRRACLRIGLPAPRRIEILPAAPLAGGIKAQRYPAFVQGRSMRVLTHVRLVFEVPVRGPVLLGAGRYHGLGLLRPEVGLG